MANTLQLKRSSVASKIPLTTDLALGEMAINTNDGRLFTKRNNGSDQIVEFYSSLSTIPVANGGTGVGTLTGIVKGNGTSAMTAAVAGTDYLAPQTNIIIGNSADQTPDASWTSHLKVLGSGYAGGISLDATGMWVGHNSGARTLILATNETARVSINGTSGLVTFNNGASLGLTGLILGNGSGAMTAAVAGTDYAGIDTANVFTVNQQISTGATSGYLIMNANASVTRGMLFRTAGSNRWVFGTSGAETGTGEAGANLSFSRYNDASGALIDTPLTINRATGVTTIKQLSLTTNLAVAEGGTGGTATPTAGGAAYGSGTALAYTAAGTSGYFLRSNGASAPTWDIPGGSLIRAVQILSSGTTYTTGTGCNRIVAFLVGGGGAGGGVPSATTLGGGGGGGAGGFCLVNATVSSATAYTIQIGAGGTGVSGAAGGNGTATTLTIGATTYSAGGGTGGGADTSAGAGGTATGSSLNVTGGAGFHGLSNAARGGNGGGSYFGTGGLGANNSAGTANGGAGAAFGSGGGGGASPSSGTARTGGNGAAGRIIVWEFAT